MRSILAFTLATVLFGTPLFAASKQEKIVALSSVPQPVVVAAKRALGTDPTLAKIVAGTSPQQYELQAKDASDQRFSVHVLADGTVVGTEKKG
jgi:hypothetical protein